MDKNSCRLFLAILSGAIIASSTVIVQNSKRVLAPADTSGVHLLLIKEKLGLLQISSRSYQVTGEFEHGEDALAVDYHYPADLLVWSTRAGRLYSCKLRESRLLAYVRAPVLVYAEERWLPAALAVDYLADRLYVLDARSNAVRVLGLRDDRQAVLHVGERDFKPVAVEVDPQAGFVFLMDHGVLGKDRVNHILRMKMDGSEPRVIDPASLASESIIGRIGLDRANRLILVSSINQKRIFAMDYEGRVLSSIHAQNGALSLSVSKDELFWVNAFNYRQDTALADGSAYRCAYEPGTGCRAASQQRLPEDGVILALRAVEPTSQRNVANSSLCGTKRRCAAGMCFETGNSSTGCACEIGWQWDGLECRPVGEFLLYEDDGIVRAACLVGKCQPIAPFRPELRFKARERTGFDYDPTTRKVYYGGKDAIYQENIVTGTRTRLLYQKHVFFGPLAIDWMTKNLFYVEIEKRGEVTFYIMKVASVRPSDPERVQASSTLLWELGGVHTIALHPNRGYLYVTAFNNLQRRYHLLRLQADAKNTKHLVELDNATFVSIDHSAERLYVVNLKTSSVMSSDLDGRDVREVGVSVGPGVTGFLVHRDVLYVGNGTSVRKYDKATGQDLGELELFPYDRRMAAGLKVHSTETLRHELGGNPCAKDNGGCDNFCFAVPRNGSTEILEKVCRCFDGVKCKGLVSRA